MSTLQIVVNLAETLAVGAIGLFLILAAFVPEGELWLRRPVAEGREVTRGRWLLIVGGAAALLGFVLRLWQS